VFAHGWLSPDGYTILPMRRPTTRIATIVFMIESDSQKRHGRQRFSKKTRTGPETGPETARMPASTSNNLLNPFG
jgi:hypothetical protein